MFQSPWIRFALVIPKKGGGSRWKVSIPVDKVRAIRKTLGSSDNTVSLAFVSIPVDKVRALSRANVCSGGPVCFNPRG